MPKKKPKKTLISFRLQPSELEPLDADRKALPGVPVARNTYARHATQSYPELRAENEKLRKLKAVLDRHAADSSTPALAWLTEAGL